MRYNGYTSSRPAILGLAKVLVACFAQIPAVAARPLLNWVGPANDLAHHDGPDPEDASLWLYLSVAAILVLLGGAFAGLTIA